MKSVNIIAGVLCLSAFALSSCQKAPFHFRSGEAVKFSAGSGYAATKASYSGETNSDGSIERINWQTGDLLRIYCDQASAPSDKFADYRVASVETPTTGSAVSTAHIEVSSPATDDIGLRWGTGVHTFYAAFPSPAARGITTAISGKDISANLPATQNFIGEITKTGNNWTAAPDLKNMLMTAKTTCTEETMPDDGEVFLSFSALTTAIQFTIKNDTGADLNLTSVQLISGNGKTTAEPVINGAFSVDLDQTGIVSGTVVTPYTGFNITYMQDYPLCTSSAATSTNPADRTLTINVGTSSEPLVLAVDDTFTFTFFLNPIHNFDDLTFKFSKADGSWMSTRLGYTDGDGIFFPRHKKSFVTGLLVPEGAQWTIKYGPDVASWNAGDDSPVSPQAEVSEVAVVTSWDSDIDKELSLKPKNNDLLPGKFSVSATEYVRFSRGNLLATRSSSSSNDWKLCFFENQYDFGEATSFTANDTEMSLFTFGFDSKETSFNPIGYTPGSEDWGNEYNRQYGLLLGTWQTLTSGTGGEWWYLLEGRPNADKLKVFKTVHEHSNCLIILPDDFDLSDMPSSAKLTDAEWSDLEKKGAVCLPQAGCRKMSTFTATSNGYWANNIATSSNGYGVFFNGANVTSTTIGAINFGYSIRLVQKFDKPIIQPNFVDLGLPSGTLWADRNVGAMSEADYGYWYAWGEKSIHYTSANPATKSFVWKAGFEAGYANSTYSFFSGSSYTKYNDTDNIKTLQVADDVCSKLYGTSFSVPSGTQWLELRDNCTKTWKVNGYEFVGPNGNKIFIPVNGFIMGSIISQYDNYGGYYWSNELGTIDEGKSFHFGGTNDFYYDGLSRSYGLGVRAVKTTSN